ncbi:thiamine diphosphokinase [Aneurinibacillus sp. Ricciae_BoGa-3]|uniref:thiamine diphosphokinase n=1 Tax=Aneurinibacillus sp. Ricciae_BoGa-3 TaxID=3022697 RepID=UPI003FA43362
MKDEKRRILLFAGGQLGDWALQEIKVNDVLVGVDAGALFLLRNGYKPHASLGDFDSVERADVEWIKNSSHVFNECDPIAKDLSDTEMALQWALLQNPREIIMLGVTGTRFDHTLANVHLLKRALEAGVACRILDETNDIQLIERTAAIAPGKYPYISLLPLSLSVRGVTLTGFMYPLENATLTLGHSLAISNKLTDSVGSVEIKSGLLLVIQSRD